MFRKIIIFAVLIIYAVSSRGFCEEKKSYRILMPGTYTVSGKNSKQMETFTMEIVQGLSKSVNADITLEISPLHDEQFVLHALLRMLKKDVDFAGFSGEWYVKMSPWLRKKFPIFFGIAIDKSTYMNNCFFVRKSDKIKEIEELRGKILGGYLYTDTRYLLYRADIDEPVMDFFSEYVYMQGPYSMLMTELVENRIDTFVSWDFNVESTVNNDPRYMDIEKIGCKTYGLNPFVIQREGLDPELIDSAREALRSWKTNPNFQNVRLFFMAIKGGIAVLDEDNLKLNLKIDNLASENSWNDERLKFLEEYAPQ